MVCRAFSVFFLCVVPLLHIRSGNSAARMTFCWRWGGAVEPAVYVCGCYSTGIVLRRSIIITKALYQKRLFVTTQGVRDIFAQPHLNIVTATLKPKGRQQTASLALKSSLKLLKLCFSTFESCDLFSCCFIRFFSVLTCFYLWRVPVCACLLFDVTAEEK